MRPFLMTRLSATTRVFVILTLIACLSGCKTWHKMFGEDQEEITETLPVEAMYEEGKSAMDANNFERSSRFYQRLVARFPYGAYSEQAQLELAYVLYKQGKQEEATSAINRFIRTYPTHRHIDYAYYLKALINFDRNGSLVLRLMRQDMATRDLSGPTVSMNDFADVIRRYPNSRYAPDSRQRMIFLRNLLARHELNVGFYYLRHDAYVAAANRGKYILNAYPQSQYEGDAVALMERSYRALGQELLATDARRVLELNYPNHESLTDEKWPEEGFFSRFDALNPFD
jgi:outer membrane protein assembly factor BamD